MLLVGLTGNIASGKTSVAEMFAAKGATVIDADVLARQAIEHGTAGFEAVRARWGDAILGADGGIDRAALRRIVFADDAEREALNAIVHPRVEALRQDALAEARARGDRIVVCDIPLLFEKDMAGRFDCIVLVDAPRSLRLQRLQRERDLPRDEAEAMLAAQLPADAKRLRSDYVIDNAASYKQLELRVHEVWTALNREADRRAKN